MPGQAVLDLRHVIAGQVVHELASDVTGVDSADLVDQYLGVRPAMTTSGLNTAGWALVEVGMMVTVDQALCATLMTRPRRRPRCS